MTFLNLKGLPLKTAKGLTVFSFDANGNQSLKKGSDANKILLTFNI